MATVDIVVIIALGIAAIFGLVKGAENEIKGLGKGLLGFFAAIILTVLLGGHILQLEFVAIYQNSMKDWLSTISSMLSNEIFINVISYIVVFIAVLIALKIVTAILAATLGALFAKVGVLNRLLGALMGLGIMAVTVMFVFAVLSTIPSLNFSEVVNGSICETFYAVAAESFAV